MKYRLATIHAEESATTAATKTIDLNLVNSISKLNIVFKPTNSNQTMVGHPALCLPKVELVDGSDVIFSASGKELRAAAYYGRGRDFVDVLDYNISSECMFEASIYFGRFLHDPELALDPTKFRNLQLKITHNKALGGATPTTATLAVFAHLFDEKVISPRGFLMTKEIFSYYPVANEHKAVDLPTDYPYRLILVGGDSAGKMPMWRMAQLKLSEDFDRKLTLPATDVDDLLQGVLDMYPPIEDHIIAQIVTTGTVVYMTAGYEGSAVGCSYGGAEQPIGFGNGAGGTITGYSGGDTTFWVHTKGWCPHNFVALPLGDKDDLADLYEVRELKNLRLDVLADSSPGTSDYIEVVTQQLRSY